MRVVLASQSPRRKELLGRIFDEFEIMPAVGPEKTEKSDPAGIVMDLSALKAAEIWNKVVASEMDEDTKEDILVIGSDTIVAKDKKILGKPHSIEMAKTMIELLAGDVHQVFTGVTIMARIGGVEKNICFAEKTEVRFNPMTGEEIEDYLNYRDENGKYEWADKAGAYGIQGFCSKFISGIYGDYYNVMGLPVAEIYKRLKEII